MNTCPFGADMDMDAAAHVRHDITSAIGLALCATHELENAPQPGSADVVRALQVAVAALRDARTAHGGIQPHTKVRGEMAR